MSEEAWIILALLFMAGVWVVMNIGYGKLYGRRLRWPYFWAAHGLLLFGKRAREWEQR